MMKNSLKKLKIKVENLISSFIIIKTVAISEDLDNRPKLVIIVKLCGRSIVYFIIDSLCLG